MGLKQDLKRIDAIVADIPDAERETIIRGLADSGVALARIMAAIRVSPEIADELSEAAQSAALSAALLLPIGRLSFARVLKIIAEDCPTLWRALADLARLFGVDGLPALAAPAELLALLPASDE